MLLHGRDAERARLAALVDDARRGRAAALVIRAEPGMGKSALLDDLVEGSGRAGVRVLRTQGLESESPLAYAALYRLLRPTMDLLARLPVPQARALRVAFGAEEGSPVDPFLVGIATLSTLTEAAEESPLLCVVDDAHWLDTASADALLFAARRIEADRVAIVFAARDSDHQTFTAEGVESLRLEGLKPDAVRSLLAEHAGDGVATDVAERLLRETGGNPLALVELPSSLTTAQLDGTAPLPAQLPIGERVERVFLDRLSRLAPQVQTLILVAAADDTGRLATIRHAAADLGIDPAAWDDAERSGLLSVDGELVQVRHPLVRSAVYQAATGRDRRRVHRALAEAVGDVDPDRQAWHLAAATDGPDEGVVRALERVAGRAERRGGFLAAAAAYERAAELTAGEQPRAARNYAAARNAWACGQTARASALLSTARTHADDPLLRADIDRLRARIEVGVGSGASAHRIFIQATRAVADLDPSRALEMAAAAALLSVYGADSGAAIDLDAVSVDVTPADSSRTRCLKQLLSAMTSAAQGEWQKAVGMLQEALVTGQDIVDLDLLGNLGNAALNLGDDQAHHRFYTTMLSSAREDGAGMSVLYALQRLAFSQLLAGQWSELRSCAEESLALSRSIGQPAMTASPLGWLTLLAALQGRADYDMLLTDLNEAAQRPLGILADPVHDLTRWAMGTRAAHGGDSSAAFHHFGRMRLPPLTRMAAMERIDAAVRAGETEQAQAWVAELGPFADATRWPWALATVDYGRAMLAPSAQAAGLFESALGHQRRAIRPYDAARTQLAYGEFLRRGQRRVDARTHLRRALETFADLRAEPLVSRATQELRASGETARKRDPSTVLTLTPMELKVAQLVAGGLSNKDVANHCWVSPRTVAFHLRNVFTKAGVTSRGALAQLDFG